MKLILLLLIISPTLTFSQSKVEYRKKVNPLALYTNPEFIGGTEALVNYVNQNLEINRKDKKRNTKGEIIIKFFIDTDGSISNTTLLNKGLSKQLNKEALRVISDMPKWKPATKNGKIVKTMYAYIITIK